TFTVAAWLSVTLAAWTTPTRALAFSRTLAGSGSTGGPSSAVTTSSSDANASRRLSGSAACAATPAQTSHWIPGRHLFTCRPSLEEAGDRASPPTRTGADSRHALAYATA